jgi:hypothetical protein
VRLEDAFLYLIVAAEARPAQRLVGLCRGAIAGGADIIHLRGKAGDAGLRDVVAACRDEGALCVVADDAALAAAAGADGVHLDGADGAVGAARTVLGPSGLIGVSTRTLDGVRLALEVGADYVLHWGGVDAPAAFAAVGRGAGGFLYAAGIDSLETAGRVVAAGVCRLCVDAARLDENRITEETASYARLLGRSV